MNLNQYYKDCSNWVNNGEHEIKSDEYANSESMICSSIFGSDGSDHE